MKEEPEFASQRPVYALPTIDDVLVIGTQRGWKTKSNADLVVLFAMAAHEVSDFLKYENEELKNFIPGDIRGLRAYYIKGLKMGSIGGGEFHRLRKEILFSLEGIFDFECEDVYGRKRMLRIDQDKALYLPNFISHTYETITSGDLLVFANTLFNADDPKTWDSYSLETFRKLQKEYLTTSK
jgi:hypothetical protein